MSKKSFTLNQAKTIGEQLNIHWDKFDQRQFRAGLGVELEHGTVNETTNVTKDDPLLTGKIALAHLTEFPDYYTRLEKWKLKPRASGMPKNNINPGGMETREATNLPLRPEKNP